MESTTQAVEGQLFDGLPFRLPAGANYSTDRKSVSFFPRGGNDSQPSGGKVITFVLTGKGQLDQTHQPLSFSSK